MINTPMAGIAPVAPKSGIFYLAAFLLGLAIPVGIIYLGNLLRFKIENRSDVEALTSLPIVGDIPLLDGVDENAIRVRGEQERADRRDLPLDPYEHPLYAPSGREGRTVHVHDIRRR